jgi:hypothetical protein
MDAVVSPTLGASQLLYVLSLGMYHIVRSHRGNLECQDGCQALCMSRVGHCY